MKTLSLTILFIFTILSHAQQGGLIRKVNVAGVSKERLTANLQRIVDSATITGLSVVFMNDGNVAYKSTFGFKNKAAKQTLNDSTIMYAASFTKPICAYLFLKLVDNGTFSLDTPIYKYLKKPIGAYEKWKELAFNKAFEKVTPRMILSHSSGLPILRYSYNNKLALLAEPGTKYYYSNEGMNLLGFIIEEYTGKKLQDLTRDMVFGPLGMKYTSMIWQPDFDKNYALGYDNKGKAVGMGKRTVAKAAGSMTTCADDYAKFIKAIFERKGLSGKLFDEMLTPQIKITSSKGFGAGRDSTTTKYNNIALSWGLGVGIYNSPYGKAIFHTGHDNGWQCYFVAYPDKKAAIIIMCNSSNFEPVADKIINLFVDDPASPFEWLGYYE